MIFKRLRKGFVPFLITLGVVSIAHASTFSWTQYGGSWSIDNTTGVYSDTTSGSGDKLVASNINEANFVLDGDVTLHSGGFSSGNAGFNFRMSDPATGTDSLKGYYAGIGTTGIQIGREDYGWLSLASKTLSLSLNTTYNLKIVANGSNIQVYLNGVKELDVTDATYTTGMIGLRSFYLPSTWSNVSLSPIGGHSVTSLVNINQGTLSISAPTVSTPFTAVNLNGHTQSVHATLSSWVIKDATGTGNGWNVTLQASQLKEVTPSSGFASGTTALTLPTGSLSLSGTRTIEAETGSKAISTTGGPIFKNTSSVIDTSSPVTVLESNSGYGLGTYKVVEPTNGLTLSLNPSTTRIDSVNYPNQATPYSSTLTYSVTSGP